MRKNFLTFWIIYLWVIAIGLYGIYYWGLCDGKKYEAERMNKQIQAAAQYKDDSKIQDINATIENDPIYKDILKKYKWTDRGWMLR